MISNTNIDKFYKLAISKGALGGKNTWCWQRWFYVIIYWQTKNKKDFLTTFKSKLN